MRIVHVPVVVGEQTLQQCSGWRKHFTAVQQWVFTLYSSAVVVVNTLQQCSGWRKHFTAVQLLA